MALLQSVFSELNEAGVRYVLVGGLAVVLHGYARLTADVDLVVDLDPDEARRAVTTLMALGFEPYAPVDPLEFADAAIRRRWATERNMMVFTMRDRTNPMRVVDLFVEHPLPFDELWSRSTIVPLAGTYARIASIDDLIRMKRAAGRAQDLIDIGRGPLGMAERTGTASRASGWRAAEEALFELMLAATPAQRLAWLEEMIVVAHQAGALPRPDARPLDSSEERLREKFDLDGH